MLRQTGKRGLIWFKILGCARLLWKGQGGNSHSASTLMSGEGRQWVVDDMLSSPLCSSGFRLGNSAALGGLGPSVTETVPHRRVHRST